MGIETEIVEFAARIKFMVSAGVGIGLPLVVVYIAVTSALRSKR